MTFSVDSWMPYSLVHREMTHKKTAEKYRLKVKIFLPKWWILSVGSITIIRILLKGTVKCRLLCRNPSGALFLPYAFLAAL